MRLLGAEVVNLPVKPMCCVSWRIDTGTAAEEGRPLVYLPAEFVLRDVRNGAWYYVLTARVENEYEFNPFELDVIFIH